jgi:hypothetical protein
VAGAWSWPLTFIKCRGQRMRGAMPPLPNTPSWHGAYLKHRDRFTFLPLPGALSTGIKRPRLDIDHSLPAPKLRTCAPIPPLPQYDFMAWCLIKHRYKFTQEMFLSTFLVPNFVEALSCLDD